MFLVLPDREILYRHSTREANAESQSCRDDIQ